MDASSEFAQSWVAAWNAHDPDAVMALYAPGSTHRMASGPERVGDDVRAMVERSIAAYPDLSFELVDSFGAERDGGHRVAVSYVMRGTQTGAINGREPSGRPIEIDGALVATLDQAGRMVSVVDHIDHHAIRVQQGTAH